VTHYDINTKIAISRTASVTRGTRRRAAEVRDVARSRARKRTGAGARGIFIQRSTSRSGSGTPSPPGAVIFKVSWNRRQFYMGFQHEGTVQGISPDKFLERAAAIVDARHR
jgi:HK97 gp10 family phage protein